MIRETSARLSTVDFILFRMLRQWIVFGSLQDTRDVTLALYPNLHFGATTSGILADLASKERRSEAAPHPRPTFSLGLHGKGYQLALKSTSGHWQPPEFGSQGSETVSTATISESCVLLS